MKYWIASIVLSVLVAVPVFATTFHVTTETGGTTTYSTVTVDDLDIFGATGTAPTGTQLSNEDLLNALQRDAARYATGTANGYAGAYDDLYQLIFTLGTTTGDGASVDTGASVAGATEQGVSQGTQSVDNAQCFNINYDLGISHEGVRAVQRFLNNHSTTTRLVGTGVGSPGHETAYYGSLTHGAVKRFQAMYADEVLTPLGLTEPTGYWGPSTRRKANTLIGCK